MASISLEDSLAYSPRPLQFGTSGRRGEVVHLTQLEIYINVLADLEYLQSLSSAEGGIRRGDEFYFGYDLRPSSTAFVPEEQGRGELAQAAVRAILDAGMRPVNLGPIPTPAIAYHAIQRRRGSIAVTGSHIPFDRNGYKTNTAAGELLKKDEAPIARLVEAVRRRVYDGPASDSLFDSGGMFLSGHQEVLPIDPGGRAGYVERYLAFFGLHRLEGMRLLVYQHSAVGRDILVEILRLLGAEVVAAGRSDTFVPIDTEDVDDEMLASVQGLVDGAASSGAMLDAVVSTDGDSDRPLVVGIERGSNRVRFHSGDLVGMVVAGFLDADSIVVPISCNDAIDKGPLRSVLEPKTRIGSPHVIAGMQRSIAEGKKAVCGWEANGGFLLGSDLAGPLGVLRALPTRDAVLPIVGVLSAAIDRGVSLPELFDSLPARYGRSARVRNLPRTIGREITRRLTPADPGMSRVEFSEAGTRVTSPSGDPLPMSDRALDVIDAIRRRLAGFFGEADGFGGISWIDYTDGVRIGFSNGDVAHLRPSGNADEFRVYALADSRERAAAIARLGVVEPEGVVRRMERWVGVSLVAEGLRRKPCAVRLWPKVQPYAWGGYELIPGLLGSANPGKKPFAELWIGDHPGAPADAETGEGRAGLDQVIREIPEVVLGEEVVARFGTRLPFLLKVLDARTMLSIQAHPDRRQAREGFESENRDGIAPDSPQRNYRDDNHKPEVHVALTDFWMLHGFRPLEEIALLLRDVPELRALMADFDQRLEDCAGEAGRRRALLRELYSTAMTMPQVRVDAMLDPLVARLEAQQPNDRNRPDFWALRASREFPLPGGGRDRGIISVYLLNLLHLRPGEGTFQAAGVLHAYLEGANVELMSNSDNVLRGGLTPKRVDADELLRVLKFDSGHAVILTGERSSEYETVYATPAEEFELSRIELPAGGSLTCTPSSSAVACVVLEGSVMVRDGQGTMSVQRGGSYLVPRGVACILDADAGPAAIYRAGVPQQSACHQ